MVSSLAQMKNPAIAAKVKAPFCRQSFFVFLQEFWEVSVQDQPLKLNWHIPFLCDELQHIAENVFERKPKEYDLIINISPGTTKSTICTIMFPAWLWTRDASLKVLRSSYSSPLSLDLSMKCRQIIESEKYKQYFPEISLDDNMNTKGHYISNKGGEHFSTSTGGTVTGKHGHVLIIDDPSNPMEAASDSALKMAREWFDGTFANRKVDKEVSVVILIMQRLHLNDLSGHLLNKRPHKKIRHLCLPATSDWDIQPTELEENYVEGLFDPTRLSRDVLEEMRIDLGPRAFAGQFGQSPRLLEGAMFNRTAWNVVDHLPGKLVKKARYWDKAGTEGAGCNTAGVLMGVLDTGKFIVLDVVKGQWAFEKREAIIRDCAEKDGIDTYVIFEQEPGSGGMESAQRTFQNLAGFSRRIDKVTGSKVVRAEPWSVEVNNGNVYMMKANWNANFIDEHDDFSPAAKYKDQVDASSGVYNHLAGLYKKKKGRAGGW